jgi:hypothetical protein
VVLIVPCGVAGGVLVGGVHRGAGREVGAVQPDAVGHRARELHVARELTVKDAVGKAPVGGGLIGGGPVGM